MSGGVDSSVAAALMHEEGHEVTGVTLKLWQGPDGEAPTHGCCTVSDSEDARRVAAGLDIPYYVFDYTDDFASAVVDPFVESYRNGRTPNPCVECNRSIKFSILLEEAARLDCDLLVTGHYARVTREGGRWRLRRGVDQSKDQSYVLHMLGQGELARTRFPVGGMTKSETRRVAAGLGLRNAHKRDSYEICFIADDYRRFIAQRTPEAVRPGRIVDASDNQLGEHRGVVNFTVGQRRGLGIAVGRPVYVTEIQAADRKVVIGPKESLLREACRIRDPNWIRFDALREPVRPPAKIRYPAPLAWAWVRPVAGMPEEAEVVFDEPQCAVTPGQAAVFYADDYVLGGGWIV